MSEIHLNPERWEALLAGRLSPEEAAPLRAHLEEPCEICETAMAEAALEAGTEVDAFDGAADEALLGVRQVGWPADELTGARIARTLGRRPRSLLWAGGATAVAAAALLFLAIGLPDGPGTGAEDGVRLKGGSDTDLPRLELALAAADGALTPLASDGIVPRSGHLLLRFDTPTEGICGHLLVKSDQQELLAREQLCLQKGSSTFSEDGQVVAIDLSDPSLGVHLVFTFEMADGAVARAKLGLSSLE